VTLIFLQRKIAVEDTSVHDISAIADTLGKLPIEALVLIVALAAIGVAALAIQAVSSIAKHSGRR
jgi:hypothetical protein